MPGVGGRWWGRCRQGEGVGGAAPGGAGARARGGSGRAVPGVGGRCGGPCRDGEGAGAAVPGWGGRGGGGAVPGPGGREGGRCQEGEGVGGAVPRGGGRWRGGAGKGRALVGRRREERGVRFQTQRAAGGTRVGSRAHTQRPWSAFLCQARGLTPQTPAAQVSGAGVGPPLPPPPLPPSLALSAARAGGTGRAPGWAGGRACPRASGASPLRRARAPSARTGPLSDCLPPRPSPWRAGAL